MDIKTFSIKKIAILILSLCLVVTCCLFLTSCDDDEVEYRNFDGISLKDVTVTYDQFGHNVEIIGKDAYPSATYELTEEHIDAGIYTQTLTFKQDGYNDLVLTATLTINKAEPRITPDQYDFENNVKYSIYDGTEKPLTCLINYEQRELATYEYYSGNQKLTTAPTNVGKYKVIVTLPEVNNYFGKTQEFNLEIKEPQYIMNFFVINPLTQEKSDSIGALPCLRNGVIDKDAILNAIGQNIPIIDGYVFEGWYVFDEPITSTFNYDQNIEVIGKYVQVS